MLRATWILAIWIVREYYICPDIIRGVRGLGVLYTFRGKGLWRRVALGGRGGIIITLV